MGREQIEKIEWPHEIQQIMRQDKDNGGLSLTIKIDDGRISVTHGEEMAKLISRDCTADDWDNLWSLLRGGRERDRVLPRLGSAPSFKVTPEGEAVVLDFGDDVRSRVSYKEFYAAAVTFLSNDGHRVIHEQRSPGEPVGLTDDMPMKQFNVSVDMIEFTNHSVIVEARTVEEAEYLAATMNEGEVVYGSETTDHSEPIGIGDDETYEVDDDGNPIEAEG